MSAEQGNVQPWRELVERVREALEYQERESMVGPLFPEALVDLDALTTQIEERARCIASLERRLAQLAIVNDWRARAEKAERALAEIDKFHPDEESMAGSIARAALRPSEDTSDES